MWLHNPDWKLLPTISFVDGHPLVLTWKYHDCGCNLIYIHYFIWIPTISSPVSDQFFHAVVKPWSVNHIKVWYNSAGYQILEQRSSCKGLDTINVSNVENTEHSYILIQEAEARPYSNRTGINGLTERLIDYGKFPNDHAEGIEEFSIVL